MTMVTGRAAIVAFSVLIGGCSSSSESKLPGEETPGDGDTGDGDGGEPITDSDGDGVPDQPDNDADGDGRPDCIPTVRATSQVPRLKNREYDRTIRDLLGVSRLVASGQALPSSLLPTDQSGSISDLAWSSYQTVGEMIAEQVMADATLRENFLQCDPGATGCLDATIELFGRRAFRRPLTANEVMRFRALASPSNTENGTAEEVAQLLLYGFLISPSFLMRSEISEEGATDPSSGRYALSSWEVASRLSYMLWGSMPDEVLDTAADDGQLSTRQEILAQASRMLADEKARDTVAEFHREYLHMGVNTRWDTFVKDVSRYPSFNEGLRVSLTRETELFFEEIVFGEGTFQDLFSSTRGYANAEMAALYGVSEAGMGSELVPVELPDRPGFLTRLGFLSAYSAASRSSPILRGAFIAKDILGIDPGAPPPGATDVPLPAAPELTTNRARVAEQTSGPSCRRCHHEFINPPGFVMEAFDTMGAFQTTEKDTGAPIDSSASVSVDGMLTPVDNPAELMEVLANSSDAQYYYAQRWVGFSFDRAPNSQDACVVEALSNKIGEGNYTILNLIADITQADSFSVRVLENGVAQ